MQKQVVNTPYVYDKEIASGNGGENSQLKKEQGKQAIENIKENNIAESVRESEAEIGHYAKSGELEELIWKIIEKTR